MSSLGFDLLDRHVIGGRADDLVHDRLTYARLLERSAAVAAGLKAMGVAPGDEVAVLVDGEDRVVVVAACVRLGALPGAVGAHVVEHDGEQPVLRAEGEDVTLDLLRRAGAGDPVTALPGDAPGYREAVLERVADVVGPLLEGRPA